VFPHTRLGFSHALALAIYSTTLVTEVLATSTRHVVAAHGSLDPVVAMRTLFVLLALNKAQESFIACTFIGADLVLLARLANVELHAAVKTVVFLASWTIKFVIILLFLGVVYERKLAISSGAPRDVLLHVDSLVEREGAILLIELIIEQLFQVAVADLALALGVRAVDWQLGFDDLSLEVLA